MKKTIIAAALFSAFSLHAHAQTATTEGEMPAVATPDSANPTAPVEGENSFTEAQAKERIAEAGFTDIGTLKLDDQGVWRGTAVKSGTSMPIGLDYQGNIVTQ